MTKLPTSLDPNGLNWVKGSTLNEQNKRLNTEANGQLRFGRKARPNWEPVWLKNETATPIAIHNIVGIGDSFTPVTSGDYKFEHMFLAVPTDEDTEVFGVTTEQIGATNGMSRIIVTGITVAEVDVHDDAHNYAQPSATAGILESTATPTSVRLLFKPAAVGGTPPDRMLCKILLGSGASDSPLGRLHCKLHAELTVNDATVTATLVKALDGRTYPAGAGAITLQNVASIVNAPDYIHHGPVDAIALVTYDITNDEYVIDGVECIAEVVVEEQVAVMTMAITGPDTGSITLAQTPRNLTAFVNETMGVAIPRDATNGYTLVGNVISWTGWEIQAGDELKITYVV